MLGSMLINNYDIEINRKKVKNINLKVYPDLSIKASIPQKVRATGGHPSKRTYQAIRIELNHELDVLKDNLDDMIDLLNPGGRICIITFHSLEDRIVKSNFRKNEKKNRYRNSSRCYHR